ncbi:MAG: hypothetical protein ACT4O1_06370 [Gemmatimonadota bacterium]
MQALRELLVVAATAFALGACAPAAKQAKTNLPDRAATTLLVTNDNWQTMHIYLVRATMRTRLGSVPSQGRTEFKVPGDMLVGTNDIIIAADPVGSGESYVSPRIQVFPGSQIAFTVGSQVRYSNFAVRTQ